MRFRASMPIYFFWCVVFLAIFIRVVGFPHVAASLYWDEMAMWNDAQSILETGRDLHNRYWFQPLFISYGDYKLPVYIWFVALSNFFSSDPLFAVRFPSFLAGILEVFGIGYLWKSMSERDRNIVSSSSFVSVAAVMAFVLAITPWAIHFSTTGFESHLSAAFLLFSVIAYVKSTDSFIKSNNNPGNFLVGILWIIMSIFLGTASVYTYFSTRYVWPVVIFAASILWRPSVSKNLLLYFAAIFIWVLTLFPMFSADFYDASNRIRLSTENVLTSEKNQGDAINVWRMRDGNSIVSRVLYNRPVFYARDIAINVATHFDPEYLFLTGDAEWRHGHGAGVLLPIFAPFLLIGFIVLWVRSWRVAAWFTLWWLVALIPASVPLEVPHALRSLNALVPVVSFVGLGYLYTFIWLWNISKRWAVAVSSLVILIILFQFLQYMSYRVLIYPRMSAESWKVGYTPVSEFVAAQRNQYEQVYISMFYSNFYLYYQPKSGVSWKEIQMMPSEGFTRNEFKNVTIMVLPTEIFDSIAEGSLVVLESERANMVPENWQEVSRIKDELGREQFVAFTVLHN